MASALVDLVKILVASSGTAALTLGPAIEGFQGTETLINGVTYGYSIQQGGNFEYGRGTYLAASNSLVRSPIASSRGGAPIDLQANAIVSFVQLAEDMNAIFQAIALLSSQTVGAVAPGAATEALFAGAFIHIDGSGTDVVLSLADASNPLKFCNGFAPAAIDVGETGLVCAFGINAASGPPIPASQVWLSDTVPGNFTTTPPSTQGHIVQSLGVAIPSLGIFYSPQPWIEL